MNFAISPCFDLYLYRMNKLQSSCVEELSGYVASRPNVFIVDSFPDLGQLAALRFIEIVQRKPDCVVSLPTGRTPEYFIKWVKRLLEDWDTVQIINIRNKYGLHGGKPDLSQIRFVQMDEFVPINPTELRSFHRFIRENYIEPFGMDEANCLLMNTSSVASVDDFPNGVELGSNDPTLTRITEYCDNYERTLRSWGGIDFFLGGLGPDGHVAFNIYGSDSDSRTRILKLNYESMAASAESLGGMSIARQLAVITIGLGTICFNPNCVAIIFAAGAAKAEVVKRAVSNDFNSAEPAHALRCLPGLRFYLTRGAASLLENQETNVHVSAQSIQAKLERGRYWMSRIEKRFLHTEPHHDDIMLGYLPFILQHRSSGSNVDTFVCATSGFNSVSNQFLLSVLRDVHTNALFPDLPEDHEYELALFKEALAEQDERRQHVALCMRIARSLKPAELPGLIEYLESIRPGQVPRRDVQYLKGQCREFEAECLWHILGWSRSQVHHLRLSFYTSDIFNPQPVFHRDCVPILDSLIREKPDVVTVALDPEGSGPDTHYKVLQAVTAALVEYEKLTSSRPTVWGYRNVWYKFSIEEADFMIPVTREDFERTHALFMACYQSQRAAEFPSPWHNGPFSEIAIRTWTNQLQDVKSILGTNNFDNMEGLIFVKEMSIDQLITYSRSLSRSVVSSSS